jgi:hypothetical protein
MKRNEERHSHAEKNKSYDAVGSIHDPRLTAGCFRTQERATSCPIYPLFQAFSKCSIGLSVII